MSLFPKTLDYAVAVEGRAAVVLCTYGLWFHRGELDDATYKRLCERAAAKLGDRGVQLAASRL